MQDALRCNGCSPLGYMGVISVSCPMAVYFIVSCEHIAERFRQIPVMILIH